MGEDIRLLNFPFNHLKFKIFSNKPTENIFKHYNRRLCYQFYWKEKKKYQIVLLHTCLKCMSSLSSQKDGETLYRESHF